MAEAFFYLRKFTEKKPQILYLGFRHSSGQMAISTAIKVLPARWNPDKGKVKTGCTIFETKLPPTLYEKWQRDNAELSSLINTHLDTIKAFANAKAYLEREAFRIELEGFINGRDEVRQFAFDLEQYIKATFQKSGMTKEKLIEAIDLFIHPPANKITLLDYIGRVIDDSTNGRRLKDGQILHERTIKRYNTTKQLLIDFQAVYHRPIDFDTIDLDFYKDLNAYMVNVKDYKPATLGKHISTLKTFLREATEEGINENLKFQSKAFKTVEDESDSIYLTEQELHGMCVLNLADSPRLDKVRDLFLIGANTGLRYSDFTNIKPHNIKQTPDGYNIEITQYKTKEKVVIPINDTVMAILKKYKNVLPEAISNQKFNDYIKEVAKRVPALQVLETKVFVKGGKEQTETAQRWELVSSHTARRSYATNAYIRGMRAQSIMAITGHQTEKSFMRYLKLTAHEHAEINRKYNR
jgi:site-specific recombinase XerD